MENSNYCIYTNKCYKRDEMTAEHIIPLSLGGINRLCIQVSEEYNKIVGSKIDGKLANDYLISCLRRRNNFRGHSNSEPLTKLTSAKIKDSNLPVQLIFAPTSKWVYDLVNRKILDEADLKGKNFSIQMPFDKHIRSLFVTKVALSIGYFVYGETFLKSADHDSLRRYMDFSIHRQIDQVEKLPLRFIDQFTTDADEKTISIKTYFEFIFKSLNCTAVKIVLCSEHFLVSVSIGGKYIGTVNFKANPKDFPDSGKFAGGKIIAIQNGHLKMSSFDSFEEKLREKLTLKN